MADDQTIIGGRELNDFLQQLPVKVERNIMRGALRAGANVYKRLVQARVPVVHGVLRKSVRVSTRSKRGTVTASVKIGGSMAYYAHMVEFGTKPHLIKVQESERSINYRLTRKRGRLTYASMRTVNRNVLQIGNRFVGPTVKHPGAQPQQFARPSFDEGVNPVLEEVKNYIRGRLTKEGINVPAPEGP